MEPRIQYAKTSDGVNIAYWTMGSGRALFYLPQPMFGSIRDEAPERWQWYRRLSERRMLIRLDYRGSGLSDRNIEDFSAGSLARDVEAVAAHLSLAQVALWAEMDSGPVAIVLATRQPELVSHLMLWSSWARDKDIMERTTFETFDRLIGSNYRVFHETALHATLGAMAGEARRLAEFAWKAGTPEVAARFFAQAWEYDATELLPTLSSPVLVLHRRDQELMTVDLSTRLAAGIPKSTLALFDGDISYPWLGDSEVVAAAIDDFLGDRPELPPALPSGTAIILFADIADSTGLTERLGDAAFRAKARELGGALRAVIRENAGTAIEGKLLGDGVLAVFTSARRAIEAALACGKAGDDAGLPLHLGLHAGDVTREKDPGGRDNVYGGAVNIASRISGLSAAGEVLVSETVRSLARTSAGVRFEDRGEQSLKGVGEGVRGGAVVSSTDGERPSTDSGER